MQCGSGAICSSEVAVNMHLTRPHARLQKTCGNDNSTTLNTMCLQNFWKRINSAKASLPVWGPTKSCCKPTWKHRLAVDWQLNGNWLAVCLMAIKTLTWICWDGFDELDPKLYNLVCFLFDFCLCFHPFLFLPTCFSFFFGWRCSLQSATYPHTTYCFLLASLCLYCSFVCLLVCLFFGLFVCRMMVQFAVCHLSPHDHLLLTHKSGFLPSAAPYSS